MLIICCFSIEVGVLYYFFVLIPQARKELVKPPEKYFVEIKQDEIPLFALGEKDFAQLKIAYQRQKKFLLIKIKSGESFPFGEGKISAKLINESIELFFQTFEKSKNLEEFNDLLRKRFSVYQIASKNEKENVFFTGYFSPVYEGALSLTGNFQYPVYLAPVDLKVAELGDFISRLKGEKIVYRIDQEKREIAPYHTLREIMKNKVLEGQSLELVYLKNVVDLVFLMLEGAGKIVLDTGESFWVNYSGDNGRVYTSLSKLLLEDGKLSSGELTREGVLAYFKAHPEQIDEYLYQNERFIFFEKGQDGPYGTGDIKLTPLTSIAVDKRIFPLGALTYLDYNDSSSEYSHFAFCQDAGAIIKGPGIVDIYFGEGEKAEKKAERFKKEGKFYFLIKKINGADGGT